MQVTAESTDHSLCENHEGFVENAQHSMNKQATFIQRLNQFMSTSFRLANLPCVWILPYGMGFKYNAIVEWFYLIRVSPCALAASTVQL